jgi:pimeloyl-ACP methyl ester carboxylesterase
VDDPAVTTSAVSGATHCGPFLMRWTETGPADAPVVLLLHGIYAGAHSYEWRELIPRLADCKVRVPDLLGAGASDRPDLEFTRAIVQSAVDALIADAGPDVHVVASSLTGAYALRAEIRGAAIGSMTLITPTGLGAPREHQRHPVTRAIYELARHTPVGDAFVAGLTSRPSVKWFQTNKTYTDPSFLTAAELDETRRAGRLPNAKQLQLAFVFDQLSIDLGPEEVATVAPTVIWGSGQGFVDPDELTRWRATGSDVIELPSGLPQVEQPDVVARIITDRVARSVA